MFKYWFSERILFLVVALTVAGLLALRPIPSILSPNDTGRYIAEFTWQCTRPIFDSSQKNIGWATFTTLLRPVCWIGGSREFMFVTVLAVPLAFLFFGNWKRGGLIWSLAALFSMDGFEFATNALRQGMGLFFLIFAIKIILDEKRYLGIAIGIFASLIHTSNIAYLPLLFWFAKLGYRKRKSASETALFVALPFIVVSGIAIGAAWTLSDSIDIYRLYYKDILSNAFILFVSLPILYVYAVRYRITSTSVSKDEIALAVYSSILIIVTLIYFPAIAYRFTFTSGILQIYMAMSANDSNVKQGIYVLVGIMVQLGVYVALANNPMKVLFG